MAWPSLWLEGAARAVPARAVPAPRVQTTARVPCAGTYVPLLLVVLRRNADVAYYG